MDANGLLRHARLATALVTLAAVVSACYRWTPLETPYRTSLARTDAPDAMVTTSDGQKLRLHAMFVTDDSVVGYEARNPLRGRISIARERVTQLSTRHLKPAESVLLGVAIVGGAFVLVGTLWCLGGCQIQ